MSLSIIIIDKLGELKTLNVKNYCEEELYKKCGFKKDTNFMLQTTWDLSLNDTNYSISMYGKNDGKKNFKNICCFPYPINQTVFYGSCALVASSSGTKINLTIDLWKQIHAFLMSEIPSNINGKSSFSFTNTSTTKSTKKEKQKETKKEKENASVIVVPQSEKELEEESYYYSSDDDEIDYKN